MSTPPKNFEPAITLPTDPARAMQDMMETIDSLRAVYVEENEALNAARTRDFMALQPRKLETTRAYHDGISQMIARKNDFLNVHPDLKSLFRKKQEEFTVVAEENMEALDRMRRSVNRLNERIMTAARKSMERDGVNYGAHGKMKGYHSTAPMTLNESA
ncbi:flagellar protein FlgN [Micavibrio aeruginosavorus]|uniref:Flagellar basal-body protein FlbY n=1 Tax=Micavibrio aeruginosavorus EPB TaxID=349215 RepID=M4VGX5_9BACT|nr:flagellar protein FlgN [Micavibrio aeruginosavorus]AGH98453.1 hypothetical protein A11S_1649 [Micavibrio aeruginosavorus EPB]